MSRALLLLAAACALMGCARRARVEVTPVPGSKPPRAIVRCRASGLEIAHVTWKLGTAVKQVGFNVPKDEAALLIQWTETAPPAQLGVACTPEDAVGRKLTAGTSLAPAVITRASVAGGLVTVEGSGLGAPLGDEDGVWLMYKGHPLRADASCKAAVWDDKKIVACAPAGAAGRVELRVATGGKLALQPVEVQP